MVARNDPEGAADTQPSRLHLPRLAVEDINAILDDLHEGYYETDLKGNFTYTNPGFCHILGYTRDELFNASTRMYSHYTDPINAERIEQTFYRVFRTGESARAVETEIIRKDGVKRVVEFSASLIRSARGQPIGFRGLLRDVTDQRRTEEALHQRVRMLTALQQVDIELRHSLELQSVLTIALNAVSVVVNADAACIALHQADGLEIVEWHGAYPADYTLSLTQGIPARVLAQHAAEWITDVTQDGDYIPVIAATQALIAAPLLAGEQVLGVLLLETSTPACFSETSFEFVRLLAARAAAAINNARLYQTAQTQLAEMQTLYDHLSALERLKTDMIRLASHDIRSPLAIVATYIELLNDDLKAHLQPHHSMYIDSIRGAVRRATQLTTDILSLERVQQNAHAAKDDLVYLDDRLVHAINDLRDACALKDQRLTLTLEDVRPIVVRGSGDELGEAISNLVSNAIKYTPEGGAITAALTREHGFAVVTITDTGFGIPQDAQSQLFEPFTRIQTQETRAIEGTGLGLFLVRRIIERHHGKLIFSSMYGTGSTFGFKLPLAEEQSTLITSEEQTHGG